MSEEIQEGNKLAISLVDHLVRMRAASCTIPVVDRAEEYVVTVEPKAAHEARMKLVEDIRSEIKATWRRARAADGQIEAFRLLERMVDRLGYGRVVDNPPL